MCIPYRHARMATNWENEVSTKYQPLFTSLDVSPNNVFPVESTPIWICFPEHIF